MSEFNERIATMTAAGPAFANVATRQDVWTDGDEFIVPARHFAGGSLSKEMRVWLFGKMSTLNTAPGNLTIDLQFAGATVWSSGAFPLNVVQKTDEPFELDLRFNGRVMGSGVNGKLVGKGTFMSHVILGAPVRTVGGAPSFLLPYGAVPGQNGGGFDTRYAQEASIGFTFSIADAANAFQVTQGFAEVIAS